MIIRFVAVWTQTRGWHEDCKNKLFIKQINSQWGNNLHNFENLEVQGEMEGMMMLNWSEGETEVNT